VGVLYGRDERLPRLLLDAFRARGDLVVGANEPYSGITHGYGLKVHGIAHGVPHAELEIRQDLIANAAGQQHWADLLAEVLTPILAHPDIKAIEHH
jgi:predicted N-formylglutamate amidohydrolase